jgi:tight adherence protein C
MSPVVVLAALAAGASAAALASLLVRPTARLAPRLRPYTIVTRAGLGRSVDLGSADAAFRANGTVARLFGPPVLAAFKRVAQLVSPHGDDHLALQLQHAGFYDMTVDEYRFRQVGQAVLLGGAGVVIGLGVSGRPALGLLIGACGATIGATKSRGRIDRLIRERTERMRLELYTVNQLLALHVRTGAGPIQASQRLVDRGHGAVVQEFDAVLSWIRNGMSEPEAFRRAAETTAEPNAARTYKLFATGSERGSDLAGALLALSEDLRDARREEMRRSAVKRRAAMLIPTVAVLAPIMLLFIAAPLPSIVFGR